MLQPFCSSHRRTIWDCHGSTSLAHLISVPHLMDFARLLSEGDEIKVYSSIDKATAHLLIVGVHPLMIKRLDTTAQEVPKARGRPRAA